MPEASRDLPYVVDLAGTASGTVINTSEGCLLAAKHRVLSIVPSPNPNALPGRIKRHVVKYVVLASVGIEVEILYGVMRSQASHNGISGQRDDVPGGVDSSVWQLRCVIAANALAVQHVPLQLQLVTPKRQDRSATA